MSAPMKTVYLEMVTLSLTFFLSPTCIIKDSTLTNIVYTISMVNDIEDVFAARTPAHLLLYNSDSSCMESISNQLHYVSQMNTVAVDNYYYYFLNKNQQFPFE